MIGVPYVYTKFITISQRRDQGILNKEVLNLARYTVEQLYNGQADADKASYMLFLYVHNIYACTFLVFFGFKCVSFTPCIACCAIFF